MGWWNYSAPANWTSGIWVMDKFQGKSFVKVKTPLSSTPLKQTKTGREKKEEWWKREKLRGLNWRQLPRSARTAFENLFNKMKQGKVNVFSGTPNSRAFYRLLFKVTLHESSFGWAASLQSNPELKGPPISLAWSNTHSVSAPIHRPACLSGPAPGQGL